jgi:hypothetical protein
MQPRHCLFTGCLDGVVASGTCAALLLHRTHRAAVQAIVIAEVGVAGVGRQTVIMRLAVSPPTADCLRSLAAQAAALDLCLARWTSAWREP